MRQSQFFCGWKILLISMLTFSALPSLQAQSGSLTVQVGEAPLPPETLVAHSDGWRYRKGTSEPVADWKTVAEASLDASWLSGPGGFGYGDPGIVGEATTLNDMQNNYTTLCIRRSFILSSAVDSIRQLNLTLDYDDGFVAYLDGVELQRANLTNGPGNTVLYNATTGGNSHEASCCSSPNPATTYDLGGVGGRLGAGTHVLAIQGVNQIPGSSDFHLIGDLFVSGGQSTTAAGQFFVLVHTNSVALAGNNTVVGSARVVVNGIDADFQSGPGTWSLEQPLTPGMNRFFIAALGADGSVLSSTNRDVIYEATSTSVGGTLAEDTAWTSSQGIIHVTSDVMVPAGLTLTIQDGVIVLLAPGVSIHANAGGAIQVNGTEANTVFFLPENGTSAWGALSATGAGASVAVHFAELAAGSVTINNQATGLIEDSYLHDRPSIVTSSQAQMVTMRRIHVNDYSETIFNSGSTILAEDSLFENLTAANSDALEIQGGPPGSIIRRCTFRHGLGDNTDSLDFNGSSGVLVDSCLVHNFTDKGVSLGAAAQGSATDHGIIVSNCLIHHVDTGIAIKDSSTAALYHNTIAAAVTWGAALREVLRYGRRSGHQHAQQYPLGQHHRNFAGERFNDRRELQRHPRRRVAGHREHQRRPDFCECGGR